MMLQLFFLFAIGYSGSDSEANILLKKQNSLLRQVLKELSVGDSRKSIGLVFGTSKGNSEIGAEDIQAQCGEDRVDLIDLNDAELDSIQNYEWIIFGVGRDQGHEQPERTWSKEGLAGQFSGLNLSGKKVAMFVYGDNLERFYGAEEVLKSATIGGATIKGATTSANYGPYRGIRYTSFGTNAGNFPGLVIDEENQSEMTRGRITMWVEQLKLEGFPCRKYGIIPIMTPDLYESMWRSATMATWWKIPGDHVEKGEIVAEMECYNSIIEIVAPATGTLEEIVIEGGVDLNSGGRKNGPVVVGTIAKVTRINAKTVATAQEVAVGHAFQEIEASVGEVDLVEMAKFAEQAERYDDVVKYMTEFTKKEMKLTDEQRNLLSAAFKNVVGARRSAWRIVSSIESTSKTEALIEKYRKEIGNELEERCQEVLTLIDDYLLRSADDVQNPVEAKVFYLKMKGDYYRYIVEVTTGDARKSLIELSQQAYEKATEEAEDLPSTHPIKLGLALNFSGFYYEIENDIPKACAVANRAFSDAIAELDDDFDLDIYKDSTFIMKFLRDSVISWSC